MIPNHIISRFHWISAGVIVMILSGCGTANRPPAEAPAPVAMPTPPPSMPVKPAIVSKPAIPERSMEKHGPWAFRYQPGPNRYAVTILARVAQFPDSTSFRSVPVITGQIVMDVDSTNQPHVIDPAKPATLDCTDTASLLTYARQLAPPIPESLSAQTTWTDSATFDGCHGGIPAMTTIARVYRVIGDTVLSGVPAVVISSTQNVTASGEGTHGQHRVLLNATGSGTRLFFLDPARGRWLGSSGTSRTVISITTSGRMTRFLQETTERVAGVP